MSADLDSNEAVMSDEQVRNLFAEVQNGMTEQIKPSLSEIYFPKDQSSDVLENGTGAFVDVNGVKLLVTNAHVIENPGVHHSFFNFDRFVMAAKQRYLLDKPYDVGVSKIEDDVWSRYAGDAQAIPLDRFAAKHETVLHEILWTAGYPGARVKNFSDLTLAVCQALPTQEHLFHDEEKPHEEFDPIYHFAVGYSPAGAQPLTPEGITKSPGLSDPHGLSGSLVWNTRRLECFYAGREWTPDLAVVTGIIWGWPSGNHLVATKVEHLLEFLAEAARLPSVPPPSEKP